MGLGPQKSQQQSRLYASTFTPGSHHGLKSNENCALKQELVIVMPQSHLERDRVQASSPRLEYKVPMGDPHRGVTG